MVMSDVKLSSAEVDGKLPRVCMVCGAGASVTVTKQFTWNPVQGGTGIAVGPMASTLGQVAALATSRWLKVQTPLCSRHKHYWRAEWWALGLGCGPAVVLVLVMVIAAVVLSVTRRDNLIPWVVFPLVAVVFGLVIFTMIRLLVMRLRSIHALGMTEDDITLTNVADEFVEAVKEQRRKGKANRRQAAADE
jgi:hypothetical protein